LENKELAESFLGYVKAMQMKFLPDIVDVKLSRNGNQVELCYKEYFTYLPEEIQDFMVPVILRILELFLKRLGLECKLARIEQGIELNVKGAPEIVVSMPLVEILMFGTTNMDKAKLLTNSMLQGLEATSSGRVFRNLDDNVKEDVEQVISQLRVAMKLAGVSTMEELMSFFSEEMLDIMLQKFKQSPSSN
jgi:hypothetical protein